MNQAQTQGVAIGVMLGGGYAKPVTPSSYITLGDMTGFQAGILMFEGGEKTVEAFAVPQ